MALQKLGQISFFRGNKIMMLHMFLLLILVHMYVTMHPSLFIQVSCPEPLQSFLECSQICFLWQLASASNDSSATRQARQVYVGDLPPTANEQSVATFFDQVMSAIEGTQLFLGAPVKVRRSSDYNPYLAAAFGPSQPNPNLNLAAVGLTPDSSGGLEGPYLIFSGSLPTKVICLTQVITADELYDDEVYQDIMVDVRDGGG